MEHVQKKWEVLPMTFQNTLKHIKLQLARSKEFPAGSASHGYDIVAPLDSEGHIDLKLWREHKVECRVRRFWDDEEDTIGYLVHKSGGADHGRWMFDYGGANNDDGEEAGYRLGEHKFLPGEYVSIRGHDGELHTFVVITVEPLRH
jgi:hypothetical protein